MEQEIVAVTSAGRYANLHLDPDITMQASHHSVFYRPDALPAAQPTALNPVPEETFTHSHLSWSSIITYLLPPSTSITIHCILSVQITCLTVFYNNLSPSLLWSTSWPGTLHFILHTLLHPVIVFFSQHMPILLQPVSVVPRLCHLTVVSLSTLYLELYLVA